MTKKLHLRLGALWAYALALLAAAPTAQAQNAVIEQSRFIGGAGVETTVGSRTVSGNTYIWGTTSSTGLPVTNGSAYAGGTDYYIAKYNSAGNLLFASYFGGAKDESFDGIDNVFEIVGDDIYFAGSTYSANLPVTNGSVYTSDGTSASDLFLAKMNTVTGGIGFAIYYGSAGLNESDYHQALRVSGGSVYLASLATSSYPNTKGDPYMGGKLDYAITKFDGNTGSMAWSTRLGSNQTERPLANMHVIGNTIYFGGFTDSNATTFTPSTDGTSLAGSGDVFYAKFDASTGSKTLLTLYGGGGQENVYDLQIENGEAYITGYTTPSVNGIYPTTDGTTKKGPNGVPDFFAMKYNSAGAVAYATLIGGDGSESVVTFGKSKVVDGSLYFLGRSNSSNYPTTNSAFRRGMNDIVVTKLNPTGAIVFSTMIGDGNSDFPTALSIGCNDELYVLGNVSGGGF